ncbi:MAG TPA: hypothetical protein VGN04_04490 [Herbaspirillum sp.]|jgi:hypothetical protein
MKFIPRRSARPLLVAGAFSLLSLLAACESVPLTPTPVSESHQAPGTLALGAGPLWARQLVTGRFNCALNDKIDIRIGDSQRSIDLKWKGDNYTMLPVTTTTGALRFEDRGSGLVWIQIPAKSMLLNAKQGRQLANDCKV